MCHFRQTHWVLLHVLSLMMPVLVGTAPSKIACAFIKPEMHCGEGWVVRIDVGGGMISPEDSLAPSPQNRVHYTLYGP